MPTSDNEIVASYEKVFLDAINNIGFNKKIAIDTNNDLAELACIVVERLFYIEYPHKQMMSIKDLQRYMASTLATSNATEIVCNQALNVLKNHNSFTTSLQQLSDQMTIFADIVRDLMNTPGFACPHQSPEYLLFKKEMGEYVSCLHPTHIARVIVERL